MAGPSVGSRHRIQVPIIVLSPQLDAPKSGPRKERKKKKRLRSAVDGRDFPICSHRVRGLGGKGGKKDGGLLLEKSSGIRHHPPPWPLFHAPKFRGCFG